MKNQKHKNVFRIDTGNTHGWQVRFKRQNKPYTKFFSDSLHGGVEGALEAALEWRDMMREKLPPPTPGSLASAYARSSTGVPGLNVTEKDGSPTVQISWLDDDGKRHGTSYSVGKWGLRKAIWKACVRLGQAREQAQADIHKMYDTAYKSLADQYAAFDV